MTTYYFLTAAFVLATLLTAFAAIRSQSPLRFVAPLSVLLSVMVGYFGIEHYLGSPKPIGNMPFWHGPSYGSCGATVTGAALGSQTLWLMLDEDDGDAPRLFAFPATEELVRGFKQAMMEHAKKTGQQYGFMFGATTRCADAAGNAEGEGADHGHSHDRSQGMQGASDGDSPKFAEPVSRLPPPKE